MDLDEFRARTAGESAVDFGLSAVISGQQDDPIAELPSLIASQSAWPPLSHHVRDSNSWSMASFSMGPDG